MTSKRESDSELLDLYNMQSSNKSFASLNNSRVPNNNNSNSYDNISNQYYKLVDDDIIKDSFDNTSMLTDNFKPEKRPHKTNKFHSSNTNSLNNNSFNSPSNFSTDQPRRRPPISNNQNESRLPAIENKERNEPRSDSVNSVDSNGQKKIIKWNFW